ncbi:MAG: hypothetical protein IRZ05_00370, partial [Micromonosporaceae bacterium]|nr:hypothetical protein [Micromonosporaceae bacterium]
ILVDFQKVREDKQEVEYIFGYPEMNHRLVISKESQQGRSLDTEQDRNFGAVVWKVLKLYRSQGSWPDRGTYAA